MTSPRLNRDSNASLPRPRAFSNAYANQSRYDSRYPSIRPTASRDLHAREKSDTAHRLYAWRSGQILPSATRKVAGLNSQHQATGTISDSPRTVLLFLSLLFWATQHLP